MGRRVSRINVKTVISQLLAQKRSKFWISGLKIDKWSISDEQNFDFAFAVPQEIELIINEQSRWASDYSISRIETLEFKCSDGSIRPLKGWDLCRYGVRFFDTQENAEKYFVEKTNKLYNLINPINLVYNELYAKVKYSDSNFIEQLNS